MWIDCGIHAREWIAPAFCLWFVHYVSILNLQQFGNVTKSQIRSASLKIPPPPPPPQSLSYYNINQDLTSILDNMDVYVLPVMNPDGYKYTWTTVRAHATQVMFGKATLTAVVICSWFVYLFIFRTGCGGRTAPSAETATASESTSTGTLTPTGAVSNFPRFLQQSSGSEVFKPNPYVLLSLLSCFISLCATILKMSSVSAIIPYLKIMYEFHRD